MNNSLYKGVALWIVMALCIVGCSESMDGESNTPQTIESQENGSEGITVSDNHNNKYHIEDRLGLKFEVNDQWTDGSYEDTVKYSLRDWDYEYEDGSYKEDFIEINTASFSLYGNVLTWEDFCDDYVVDEDSAPNAVFRQFTEDGMKGFFAKGVTDYNIYESESDAKGYYTGYMYCIEDEYLVSVFLYATEDNSEFISDLERLVDSLDFSGVPKYIDDMIEEYDTLMEDEEEEEPTDVDKVLVEKYLESVKYIYDNKVDLFGNEVESFSWDEDDNQFAIEDVDHDGVPELIISWTDCSMVGTWGGVYQYDFENEQYVDEGIHDEGILFYENGLAVTEAGHNHSYGEMWPYFLYMYNPEQDKYEFVFSAYSWEKQYKEEGFPDDADTDNVGIVYYVEDDLDSTEEVNPISQTQYNNIYNQYFSETEELDPVYYPLSDVGIEEYQEVLEVLEYERTN